MALNQLRDANMTVGYVGGMCLKYVQDAFGTDHPYPTALAAWNANTGNGNHPNQQPPLGVTVPIYFSLGNVPAGHVAIRLDDGMVASSSLPGSHGTPFYYKSIDALVADYAKYNGGCSYLGWSEYVGTVHVIQDLELATADQINQAYQELLGRAADPDGLTHYAQYTLDFVRQDLAGSAEHRNFILAQQTAAKAAADAAKAAADEAAAQQKQSASESVSQSTSQPIKVTIQPPVIAQPITPKLATIPDSSKPATPNPLVRFLFELYIKLFKKA